MPLYLRFVLYLQVLSGDPLSLHTDRDDDDNLITWTIYGNKTYRTRLGSIHKNNKVMCFSNTF